MDTNNAYQFSNNNSSHVTAGGALGYDVEAKKQRIAEGYEAVTTELLEKWNKEYAGAQIFPVPIASMHPGVIDFLLSFKLVALYDDIAKRANLDAKGRSILPRLVWQIAQSKKWDGIDEMLESNLPLVHSAHVIVVDSLRQDIFDELRVISEKQIVRKEISENAPKKQMQLALSNALSQYPKLGEQNISINQIQLKYFPTPVRPSIKNWITDFHDAMGSGKHSPIDRGNFLFHGENGKKLTAGERQRVAVILKSLDDQSLLTVDPEAQKVIFEIAETSSPAVNKVVENFAKENLPLQAGTKRDWFREKAQRLFAKPEGNNFENESAGNSQAQPAGQNVVSKNSFAPNLLVKPENAEKTQNFSVINRESMERMQNETRPDASMMQKKEEISDAFQVPQSKPPVGSEEFSEKNIDGKTQAENGQTRDSMSDELLYGLFKEKGNRQVEDNVQKPNFSIGSVSFSSAQKFPAEQNAKPAQAPTEQIQQQTKPVPVQPILQQAPQPAQPPQVQKNQPPAISPYRITPSSYKQQEKDALARLKGNIIDLKN